MPDSRLSPAALSALGQDDFTAALAGIYEHSPWIAQRSWAQRPFASRAALEQALAKTLAAGSSAEQLALIRAHPELAGKAAVRGELTDDSRREQAGARLDQCSPEEFAAIGRLNREYGERFGFPFIVAVKGLSRAGIIEAMARRMVRSRDDELAEALKQIERIANLRLAERVGD